MSSDLVHRYLWRDYSLPIHKAWVLTVTDAEALALFSFVTTLIAYTQSRAWHLERDIFNRLTAAKVQLPVPDQRESFSQGAAIGILVRLWSPKRNSTQLHRMNRDSPWLGFIAIANILGFISLGIILPWSLSGGIEMPLVLSRNTGDCVAREYLWDLAHQNAILADQTFRQCWMNRSEISGPCSRLDGILAERPEVVVSRHDACPFKAETCKRNFQTVRLEHISLSLRDFGVNSHSKISIGHRLTCSPLETVTFLNVPPPYDCKGVSISFYDPNIPDLGNTPKDNSAADLMACNEPNKFSDVESGKAVFMDITGDHNPPELFVWPKAFITDDSIVKNDKLHPNLQRNDGQVFVLGFKAAPALYLGPIDDPLFSAHQILTAQDVNDLISDANDTSKPLDSDERLEIWMPDQEITAIGCVEQYRICNWKTAMPCTHWTDRQIILSNDQDPFQIIEEDDRRSETYAAIHIWSAVGVSEIT